MTAWGGVFKVQQGTTWIRTVTIEGIDYSAYSGRMHLRRSKSQSTADLALTTENGGVSIALSGSDICGLPAELFNIEFIEPPLVEPAEAV